MTEVAEPPVASAGALLRQAREAAGLHVAALAVALKVPVRKLEALEAGRYEEIGDAVFTRGLASAMCRALKLDPQPVLERLPQSAAPRLVRDIDGINTPFRAPGDGPAPRWFDRLRQPVPAVVLLLVVGAVAMYFLPSSLLEGRFNRAASPQGGASAPAPAVHAASEPAAAASELAPVFVPAPEASASQAATAAPSAAAPASSAPAAAAAAPQAPASAGTAQAAAQPGIVTVHAKGESWVEVRDAQGAVLVRKLMAAGETADLGGALPLQVTIGKVDQTEVEVRGRKFDMRPVSRDNVARFTVR